MRKGIGCAFGFGLLLLAVAGVGVFWLADSVERVTSDSRVEGVIVDLLESRDSDGDLVYKPVVEFSVDGVTYRIESAVSYGGLGVPDLGDVRTVYYDADNPADATFRGFWTLWFIPGLLAGIPLLILLAMIVAAIRARGRRETVGAFGLESIPVQPPWKLDEAGTRRVAGGEEIVADFMGAEVSPMDPAGRVQHRARAQAEIGDKIWRFEGPWLERDPTVEYMNAGNRVKVRIDPNDPTRYEVLGPAPR